MVGCRVLRLIPSSNIGSLAVAPEAQLRDVLAVEWLSQVTKVDGFGLLRGLVVWVCSWMNGEDFVVTEGVDSFLGEEACMVHGAMVDYLDQRIIFLVDGRVVDVDESVRAPREQDVGAAWVVLKLAASVHLCLPVANGKTHFSYIVVVALDVLEAMLDW